MPKTPIADLSLRSMRKKSLTDRAFEKNLSAEASVFRAAVRDVKPLIQAPLAAGRMSPKAGTRRRKPAAAPLENLDSIMPLINTESTGSTESYAEPLSFQRGGVRSQVMRRLRRGLYPTEDELDLHGLNQAAARDRLADFIGRSRDAGYRCVRIIHGKGYRSGTRGPVLKTAVNLWLRRHSDVMAFTFARSIDGGTGALYVLLRA
jgi:DNA-nicking Smr family endonuclease